MTSTTQPPSPGATASNAMPAGSSACRPNLPLTHHATRRIQQRGIPPWFLQLLLAYGHSRHDGHGAVIKTVDRAARGRMQAALSRAAFVAAEAYFDVYAVVALDDDAVVTVAHRTRRRRLH